jgi:hypothetical protein
MERFHELNSVGTPVILTWEDGFSIEMNNSSVKLQPIPFVFTAKILALIRASTTKESLIDTLEVFANICKD